MPDDGNELTVEQRNQQIVLDVYRNDPAARDAIQAAIERKNPNAVFPERIAKRAAQEAEQTFGAKLLETRQQLERVQIESTRANKHRQWQDKGYDPADVERVIVQYNLQGTPDLSADEMAFKILNAESITAAGSQETAREQGRMRMPEDWAKIAKQPDSVISAFAEKLAHDAVNEIQKTNRAASRGFQPAGYRR
jgi:hypothetical protein